jgi:hypothetical protein
MVKIDENGPGVGVNLATSSINGYVSNPFGNIIQIPSNNDEGQTMDPPHSRKHGDHQEDDVKHGADENRMDDYRARASSASHAHGHNDNAVHGESKENNDSDDNYSDDPKSRTSASSRVNFSKLTAEEKERRCHNMSKEVKQLRRKIRNMEERLARANNGGDFSIMNEGSGVSDVAVQRAKEKIKSYRQFELSDQKDLIENLCNIIVQERLKPDSLAFYMI